MLDERSARVRTHRNNIARYRGLLRTNLTDLERQFIERRLSVEQSEFELLSAGKDQRFTKPDAVAKTRSRCDIQRRDRGHRQADWPSAHNRRRLIGPAVTKI